MAQRDFESFLSFVSEEAVFFSGKKALRGKLVGTFTSIWQLDEKSHQWRIIFDKGNDACDCSNP